MAVNWLAIKTEYLTGNGSYATLAEKYGVHKSTIANKAGEEGWVEQREEQRRANVNEYERRKREAFAKVADAKEKCESLIWEITRKKLQSLADEMPIEDVEAAELRRLQQIYSDMSLNGVSNIAGMTEEDDPLTKALNEIAEKLDKGNADADQ